ncbi:MAG: DUF1189 family protein [Candidatus Paceibacterota bacterium]|jgi:hypothetical protein
MKLFTNFKNSVYSPKFYSELKTKPFSFSFKYYFSLSLVLSIILAFIFSYNLIPVVHSFLDKFTSEAVSSFPAELKIDIKNGQATSNVVEPYFIKIPNSLKAASLGDNKPVIENLIVIDTKNDFTVDKFKSYNTATWLTKDAIIIGPNDEDLRVTSLQSVPDITIDKSFVITLVDRLKPLTNWLSPVLVFGSFIIAFLLFLVKLIYAFLMTLFVMAIGKIKKVKLNYWDSYRIVLHAMSLSLIFYVLGFIFFPRVIFLFSIILLVVVWLNLKPESISEPAANTKIAKSY